MRALAAVPALLLAACGPRFLMVQDGSHGTMVWGRYKTLEACERANRDYAQSGREIGIDASARCTTERDLRRRRR